MGAFRLVPLIRDAAPGDLRIATRHYGAIGVVGLDSGATEPGLKYVSYVPHGFVISCTNDGTEAALGASFTKDTRAFVKLHHRMVKREDAEGTASRFRLLPLHLAMEGFLALHFRGPEILWSEYSDAAKRRGLDPRTERSMRGTWIPGFADALRVFEIHEGQVGMLVFVAEALASVFVVSHPDDYRRVHLSLLEDFFGELLYTYAMLHPEAPTARVDFGGEGVRDVDDLARRVVDVRAQWTAYTSSLTTGLFAREVRAETVRRMGRFTLERFLPTFELDEEHHIGERIVRADGTLEYMKTMRLSQAQVRRAYLLGQLADAEWDLEAAAVKLRCSKDELVKRLANAGLGYILKAHLVRGAR
jgi:hypothetical protein